MNDEQPTETRGGPASAAAAAVVLAQVRDLPIEQAGTVLRTAGVHPVVLWTGEATGPDGDGSHWASHAAPDARRPGAHQNWWDTTDTGLAFYGPGAERAAHLPRDAAQEQSTGLWRVTTGAPGETGGEKGGRR